MTINLISKKPNNKSNFLKIIIRFIIGIVILMCKNRKSLVKSLAVI